MDKLNDFETKYKSQLNYLEHLRKTGNINILDAVPYLEALYLDDIIESGARQILNYFLHNYNRLKELFNWDAPSIDSTNYSTSSLNSTSSSSVDTTQIKIHVPLPQDVMILGGN